MNPIEKACAFWRGFPNLNATMTIHMFSFVCLQFIP